MAKWISECSKGPLEQIHLTLLLGDLGFRIGENPYLYRHLAACDLAVVQGGLTTSMELTANERPFLYFPLGHHFEQRFHVAHRLDRYRAGRRMDFDHATPGVIAQAIAEEIGRDVDYRPVETDGARRVAQRIAELLN
jgi:UDP:flavonoid glycosyltransferase YjiC (YdhE family)